MKRHLKHEEFIQAYRARKISISVNRNFSFDVVSGEFLPKRYYFAILFWSWIWFISIPIGIFLIITKNIGWVIGLIVLSFILPGALKDSASEFVRDQALEDKKFYEAAIKSGLIVINSNVKQEL